jgi:hypothetical protein
LSTDELKQQLTEYITAARDYKTRKRIFWEERDEMENKILAAFALPVTYSNYTMMFKAATSRGEVAAKAEEMKDLLQETAESFFSAPAKSDIKLLKEAKENKENDQEILPLLGFSWGDYNSFVYHNFFLKGLCTEQELISILKQAKPYKLPYFIQDINTSKKLGELQTKTGLPYLVEYRDFVKYVRGRPLWNMKRRNKKRSFYKLPNEMTLDHFYITRILGRPDHVWTSMLVEHADAYVELTVLLTYHQLYEMLDAARYYSYSYAMLHGIEYYRADIEYNEQFIIRSKPEIGKNIEILNVSLVIKTYDGPLSKSLRGIYYMSEEFYM